MRKSNIAVGTFVWWSRIGNSTSQNISSPGIISKVSETGFHVVTFDDWEETKEEIPFKSAIVKDEFVVISQERALNFHQEKTGALRGNMVKLKKEAQKAEQDLREHTQKSERHWRSHPLCSFLRGFETA